MVPFCSHMYGGPQVSRQKKKAPGKRKTSAAKEKCSRQKRKTLAAKINWLQQKKKVRGKRKMLVAKKKLVTLIASAKIPEREGSISPYSFYG